MAILTLIVGLLALIVALLVFISLRRLNKSVAWLRDSYLRHSRNATAFEEKTEKEIAALRYEFKKYTNQLKFHKDMTFKEALEINPRVEEVMAVMHVGGCPDCAVDLNETLEHGAAKNSVDVRDFLIALNNLPDPGEENRQHFSRDKVKSDKVLRVIR